MILGVTLASTNLPFDLPRLVYLNVVILVKTHRTFSLTMYQGSVETCWCTCSNGLIQTASWREPLQESCMSSYLCIVLHFSCISLCRKRHPFYELNPSTNIDMILALLGLISAEDEPPCSLYQSSNSRNRCLPTNKLLSMHSKSSWKDNGRDLCSRSLTGRVTNPQTRIERAMDAQSGCTFYDQQAPMRG